MCVFPNPKFTTAQERPCVRAISDEGFQHSWRQLHWWSYEPSKDTKCTLLMVEYIFSCFLFSVNVLLVFDPSELETLYYSLIFRSYKNMYCAHQLSWWVMKCNDEVDRKAQTCSRFEKKKTSRSGVLIQDPCVQHKYSPLCGLVPPAEAARWRFWHLSTSCPNPQIGPLPPHIWWTSHASDTW